MNTTLNDKTSSRNVRIASALVLFVAVAMATSSAWAEGLCVSIDQSQDMLSSAEQKGAVAIFRQELEKRGVQTKADDCGSSVLLSHVTLGDSITIMVVTGDRHLDKRVPTVNDLPGAYSQLAGALVGGSEVTEATNRDNVTSAQANPHRVKADSVLYAGLGYGMIAGAQTQGGPSLEAGYRYELDWVAVDLSMDTNMYGLNEDRYSDPGGQQGGTFGFNLDALYFFDPMADRSVFVGAGLGWTFIGLETEDASWEGSGLAGRALVGYELLRSSNIRLMIQAQAVLPFYTLSANPYDYDYETGMPIDPTTDDSSRWAPTFTTSLGIGWN